MTAPIIIKKLDYGYLVQMKVAPDRIRDAAALSNGHDLCEWIANWSGAKVDIFEHYEPAAEIPVFERLDLPGDDLQELYETDTPATPPQEPQDSDPEPETVEVPDEPENERQPEPAHANPVDERPAVPVTQSDEEIEAITHRQTIDQQAIKFVGYLDKKGASKRWVKASYTDISIELDVTAPIVKTVIDHAKEMLPKLRCVRVMSGEAKGNNFTFNPDLPEPDAPVEKPEPVVSNSPDEAVLKFLKHRMKESGLDEFTATISSIASATGLKPPAVVNIMARLGSKDIIHKVRESNGVAVWRFTEAGMQVAA